MCVAREHPVGGTLVTAESVFSPPVSFASPSHRRLMQMCGFSVFAVKRPPAKSAFSPFVRQCFLTPNESISTLAVLQTYAVSQGSHWELYLTRSHIHASVQTAMNLREMSLERISHI